DFCWKIVMKDAGDFDLPRPVMSKARQGSHMSSAGELSPGEASPKVRPVGRPRTLDAGGASLALVLNLIRLGEATARLDIERRAELGRAAVTDRLATLEHL